ncbi:hypothetical protein [Nocardia carnea]|uniref:Uncharacterized protein n=1 Tax=Nocardia carnea TaxID=37328 RepID=A0ABW7TJ14_9NOCA|nr:hypothetical protein [Nocardia carnea]
MDTATTDADLETPDTTPGTRPGDTGPTGQRLSTTSGPAETGSATALDGNRVLAAKSQTTSETTGTPTAATAQPASGSGTAAGTSGGLQAISAPGGSKPFYQISLVRLPDEPDVNAFIDSAEQAMQKSVDILGFGRTDPPPPPASGKTPDKVQAANLPGSGRGVEQYQQQVMSASARQDSMVDMDAQVGGTSQRVAAEQAQTLFAIQHIEADLNAALRSVRGKKLNAAQQAAIFDHIAAAVTAVHDKVSAAQDTNIDAAGGSSGAGGPGGTGAAGQAGAAMGNAMGGIGSMLPMLAMLPMALMPMLPELLGQKDKDEEEEGEGPPSEPAPSPGGPTPIDPTAPQGASPTPGETAPPNGNTPGTPQTDIPYGPTPPSKQV